MTAAPKARLNIGLGSGQPNAPASEPLFVPMNPWGRAMPKPPRPERRQLYQVVIRDKGDGYREKRVGPACEGPEAANAFCLTIADQIALGRETTWESPRVVMLIPDKGKPVPFLGV